VVRTYRLSARIRVEYRSVGQLSDVAHAKTRTLLRCSSGPKFGISDDQSVGVLDWLSRSGFLLVGPILLFSLLFAAYFLLFLLGGSSSAIRLSLLPS